ncbi:MAG: GyrI-like domain-containing protein [Thermoplasmata archaeon]
MTETIVELENVSVLRVRADWNGPGPAAAFALLESRLTSLKGRRFYGVFRKTAEGEEYYACVARVEGDDPASLEIETGEIPGGWYARRTIQNWERDVTQIAIQFKDMIRVLGEHVDRSRPEIEFYRS